MTHLEFKHKLGELKLTLVGFSELVNIPYSTVSKFGKSNPVPSWLEAFLHLYEQNVKLEAIKHEIKILAEKI